MDGIVGDRILRCSDGHLFTSGQGARVFLSFHLGAKRLLRCPVDQRWRIASNVRVEQLSDAERAEAAAHRF